MNKKQIEMILAIEEFANISKAADYLGITQATLSKFLANTEKKFSTKIFYRYARQVIPSEEGEILLYSFKNILDEYKKIEITLASLRNGGLTEISIGTHQVIGKFIVPKIESVIQKEKNIKLNYSLKNSRKITEDVVNGVIDLGIVAEPQKYPDLIIKPIWKEFIGLYSMDGKLKEDILYNSNMIFANKILNQISYENKKKVDDYNLIYSILKRTNSMGLLPNPIAESENKLKMIKKFKPSIDICLIYSANKTRNKAFTKMISTIIECSKK